MSMWPILTAKPSSGFCLRFGSRTTRGIVDTAVTRSQAVVEAHLEEIRHAWRQHFDR